MTPWVVFDDVQLHVVDSRTERRTLLLVHGWGSNLSAWDAVAELAATQCRVVRADLRGHGLSSLASTPHTVERMAADLAKVLVELDLVDVVVVGHSMGANVAVRLALNEPERVCGVVCVDPAYGDPHVADAPRRIERLREVGAAAAADLVRGSFPVDTPAALVSDAVAVLLATDPRVLIESLRSNYLAPDAFGSMAATARVLATLRQPLLSVYAAHEVAVTAAGYAVSDHTVVTITGAGHYLPITRPSDVWQQICGWLSTGSTNCPPPGGSVGEGEPARRLVWGQLAVQHQAGGTEGR